MRAILVAPFYLFGFRVVDPSRRLAQLDATTPVMLIANHAAFIDSVYFILATRSRLTICGAKPRLFSTPFRRVLMALANVIEVADEQGFLEDTRELLESGENILVYPEMGRRSTGLGSFENWAARTALATSASVLPCYIYGTTAGHSGSTRLLVGELLEVTGDPDSLNAEMRVAIEGLEATTR